MNEHQDLMDDSLRQFEQDLKSLTPNTHSAKSPIQSILRILDSGVSSPPIAVPLLDDSTETLQQSNHYTLKTVAIAGATGLSTGLAAGLMLAAFWYSGMIRENSVTQPNFAYDRQPSLSTEEPALQNAESNGFELSDSSRSNELSLVGEAKAFGFRRFTSIHPLDESILHPLTSLESIQDDLAIASPRKSIPHDILQPAYKEHSNAPIFLNHGNSVPASHSTPQPGQHQMLKSLLKTDALLSI